MREIAVLLIAAIGSIQPKSIHAFNGLIGYRDIQLENGFDKRYYESEKIVFRKHSKVFMDKDDDVKVTYSDTKPQPSPKAQKQLHRIGGRRKSKRRANEKSSFLATNLKNVLNSSLSTKYRKGVLWLASAALVWIFFLSRFFDGTRSPPNFVYYQSSVIERRVVGPDGNVETSRQESFKSNLPDLVRQQQQPNTQSIKDLNEAEMRRIDEQFRRSDEQLRRSMGLLIDAERKFLLDDFI